MDSQQPSTVQLGDSPGSLTKASTVQLGDSPGSLAKAVLVNSAAVLVNSTVAVNLHQAASTHTQPIQQDTDTPTTSRHSALCDAYELKYSKVLKEYENTQEVRIFFNSLWL